MKPLPRVNLNMKERRILLREIQKVHFDLASNDEEMIKKLPQKSQNPNPPAKQPAPQTALHLPSPHESGTCLGLSFEH